MLNKKITDLGATCHYERINKKWFVVWGADFPNDGDFKEQVSEKEAWFLECGYLIGKSEVAK